MSLILVILVLLILFGGGGFYVDPSYRGPYMGGGVGLVLVILLVLYLTGNLHGLR